MPSLPDVPEDCCKKTYKAPLVPLPIMSMPFQRIAMDMIVPLSTQKGYFSILTVVDYATKYPETMPMKRTHIEHVADALVDLFPYRVFPRKSPLTVRVISSASP